MEQLVQNEFFYRSEMIYASQGAGKGRTSRGKTFFKKKSLFFSCSALFLHSPDQQMENQ